MFQVPGRRADSHRIGLYTNFLDTTVNSRKKLCVTEHDHTELNLGVKPKYFFWRMPM